MIYPSPAGYNQHTSQPMLLLEKTQKMEKVTVDTKPQQNTSPGRLSLNKIKKKGKVVYIAIFYDKLLVFTYTAVMVFPSPVARLAVAFAPDPRASTSKVALTKT